MSRGYCGACGELFDDYAACGCKTRGVSYDLYNSLRSVLEAAFKQASQGKGRERHAEDKPFDKQDICQEARDLGLAFPIGQARKKLKESLKLLEIKGPDAAIADILGAINYAAAAVIVLKEQSATQTTSSNAENKLDIRRCVEEHIVPVQEDSTQSATINRDSIPNGYENGQPTWD